MTETADTAGRSGRASSRAPATRTREGYVERDGVRVFCEVYGEGEPTIVLLPTWSIVHSRHWKVQIPYLARHARVVTFDGRGNGRSDRPDGRRRRTSRTSSPPTRSPCWTRPGRERAVARRLLARRAAGRRSLAADASRARRRRRLHRARPCGLAPGHPERQVHASTTELDDRRGLGEVQHATTGRATTAASSSSSSPGASASRTRPSRSRTPSAGGWRPTPRRSPTRRARARLCRTERFRDTCARVRCPVLVIHGDDDRIRPHAQRRARSPRRPAARSSTLEGSGHLPQARDPVRVNLLLRDFVAARRRRRARWMRGRGRRRRALFVSSPIGLGHAQRDVAIADELRRLHPGPRGRLARAAPGHARARGARRADPPRERAARRASRRTSSRESAEHDLHVLPGAGGGWTRSSSPTSWSSTTSSARSRYDLWIGDEAWELDYFLHENPELKTRAVRLADRLRRLAADARRRRARGVR